MANFDAAFARLDAFVEQRMAALNIPGVSLSITDRERLLRVKTYGYADLATRTPLQPDHLLQIGSVTKSFTAIAVLQLHEQGLLDLHAPVTDYLPWFKVQSEFAPITVHHLLCHTSGIIRGSEHVPSVPFEVWALRDTQAGGAPDALFRYSNVGYKVLGQLLESVLQQPYGNIIQERILDPLGMTATDPVITHDTRERQAVGYRPFYDDRLNPICAPLVPVTWLESACADTCIASTPRDMAAYARMLLNQGSGPRGTVLSEASFQLMIKPHAEITGWPEGVGAYGYGLAVGIRDDRLVIGHGGYYGGHLTSLLCNLSDGIAVVVQVNTLTSAPHPIVFFALDLLSAAQGDRALPDQPAPVDPLQVSNAAGYAGRYSNGSRTLVFEAEGDRLFLSDGTGGGRVPVEGRTWDPLFGWGPDELLVHHPDYARFLVNFGRETPGDPASPVVEASYGPNWYISERYTGPTEFEYPRHWDAYIGHYRSYNPDAFLSNFRVILRKGVLLMVDALGLETSLVALDDDTFRIGEDTSIPERIRFDTAVDGRVLRANVSGADYYRFFTP